MNNLVFIFNVVAIVLEIFTVVLCAVLLLEMSPASRSCHSGKLYTAVVCRGM